MDRSQTLLMVSIRLHEPLKAHHFYPSLHSFVYIVFGLEIATYVVCVKDHLGNLILKEKVSSRCTLRTLWQCFYLCWSAISVLWVEFVREVRWCWEELQPLPRMPANGSIDLSTCLINQKLHMVIILSPCWSLVKLVNFVGWSYSQFLAEQSCIRCIIYRENQGI